MKPPDFLAYCDIFCPLVVVCHLLNFGHRVPPLVPLSLCVTSCTYVCIRHPLCACGHVPSLDPVPLCFAVSACGHVPPLVFLSSCATLRVYPSVVMGYPLTRSGPLALCCCVPLSVHLCSCGRSCLSAIIFHNLFTCGPVAPSVSVSTVMCHNLSLFGLFAPSISVCIVMCQPQALCCHQPLSLCLWSCATPCLLLAMCQLLSACDIISHPEQLVAVPGLWGLVCLVCRAAPCCDGPGQNVLRVSYTEAGCRQSSAAMFDSDQEQLHCSLPLCRIVNIAPRPDTSSRTA